MKELVSRSTFAYAAVMFAVLFAPLVSRDPNQPAAHAPGLLPGPLTLALLAVVVCFCVRQSLQHRPAGEPRFLRGLTVASIASALAGVLDGIGIAGLAPSYLGGARIAPATALLVAGVVWIAGTLFAAAFALVLARPVRAPRARSGEAA
jgi:hypothetical protein